MDISSTTTPVARKEHTCDWCLQKIHIGEAYNKQTIFDNGSAYTWKNHRHCAELASRLKMFEAFDYGDGLCQSDFHDCITEEYRDIVYEKDKTTFNSKNPMPPFAERMKVVREHHDL
jgi:hypothetical protein